MTYLRSLTDVPNTDRLISAATLRAIGSDLNDGRRLVQQALIRTGWDRHAPDSPNGDTLAFTLATLNFGTDLDAAARVRVIAATIARGTVARPPAPGEAVAIVGQFADMIDAAAADDHAAVAALADMVRRQFESWLSRTITLAWVQGSSVRNGGLAELTRQVRLSHARLSDRPGGAYEVRDNMLTAAPWRSSADPVGRWARVTFEVGGVEITVEDGPLGGAPMMPSPAGALIDAPGADPDHVVQKYDGGWAFQCGVTGDLQLGLGEQEALAARREHVRSCDSRYVVE